MHKSVLAKVLVQNRPEVAAVQTTSFKAIKKNLIIKTANRRIWPIRVKNNLVPYNSKSAHYNSLYNNLYNNLRNILNAKKTMLNIRLSHQIKVQELLKIRWSTIWRHHIRGRRSREIILVWSRKLKLNSTNLFKKTSKFAKMSSFRISLPKTINQTIKSFH